MTLESVLPAPAGPTEQQTQQTLKALAAPFEQPSLARAIWQVVNSFGPYVLLWVAMY